MPSRPDQIAKRVLQLALESSGQTLCEQEVPSPDPQRIDVWYVPGPPPPSVPAYLALLHRMVLRPALLEPFSRSPDVAVLRDNQRKQLNWHHHLRLEARRLGQPLPPLPRLWVFSPGRPGRLLSTYRARPLPGWPPGFYGLGRGFRLSLLVLRELPPGPHTIVLRLLGSPLHRERALHELALLPAHDPEAQALRGFVACLRYSVARDTTITDEEKRAFMTAIQAEFQRFQRDLIDEGLSKGREEGLREAIRDLCEVFQLELSPERAAQLEAMDLPALQSLRAHLKQHRSWG